MSLEAELKKFELSSVFTINFSWLKRYVESDNGMYTLMKNISDEEFREIENSFYALQATWKAWREAKAQAALEWISVEDGLPSDGQNIIAFDAIKHCVFKDGEFLQGYFEPDTGHEYTEPVDVTHWIAIEPQEPTND